MFPLKSSYDHKGHNPRSFCIMLLNRWNICVLSGQWLPLFYCAGCTWFTWYNLSVLESDSPKTCSSTLASKKLAISFSLRACSRTLFTSLRKVIKASYLLSRSSSFHCSTPSTAPRGLVWKMLWWFPASGLRLRRKCDARIQWICECNQKCENGASINWSLSSANMACPMNRKTTNFHRRFQVPMTRKQDRRCTAVLLFLALNIPGNKCAGSQSPWPQISWPSSPLQSVQKNAITTEWRWHSCCKGPVVPLYHRVCHISKQVSIQTTITADTATPWLWIRKGGMVNLCGLFAPQA